MSKASRHRAANLVKKTQSSLSWKSCSSEQLLGKITKIYLFSEVTKIFFVGIYFRSRNQRNLQFESSMSLQKCYKFFFTRIYSRGPHKANFFPEIIFTDMLRNHKNSNSLSERKHLSNIYNLICWFYVDTIVINFWFMNASKNNLTFLLLTSKQKRGWTKWVLSRWVYFDQSSIVSVSSYNMLLLINDNWR